MGHDATRLLTGHGQEDRAASDLLTDTVYEELRQLARDRLTIGFIVGIPSLQLILFGYAINLDVRHIPTPVVDRAASPPPQ